MADFVSFFGAQETHGKTTGRSRDRVGPQLTCRCQLGWICEWLPLRNEWMASLYPLKKNGKGKMIQASFWGLFKKA